jgi:hypothetical protein
MASNAVATLTSMFPDLSYDVIQAVLNQKNNNVDQAIEALLALNVTSSTSASKLQEPVVIIRQPTQREVIQKVMRMTSDTEARNLASKYGLNITTVAWEDAARTKGSCWGPCISDMTLNVENNALPLIRHPNYEDLTWDVAMDKIPLVVGNELPGGQLYTITLKEYLQNFRMYLHKPESWKGSNTSLLAESRDSHVIMSSQACFLPVAAGGEAKFNVSIYNYQSSSRNPAVLAIVATAQGTSAQVVEGGDWGGQKLYFNKNGEKASFIGERLSDNRRARGVAVEGAMTREEKQQNMIMIIQVPLKQKQIRRGLGGYGGMAVQMECCALTPCSSISSFSPAPPMQETSQRRKEKADVEEAIIRVGEGEGEFDEVRGLEIERDPAYPVRVTLQFYKSTANGVIDEDAVRVISEQIEASRKNADFVGSLVVGGRTSRPTEFVPKQTVPLVVPPWWSTFWLTYKTSFPSFSEDAAKELLFANNRFANSTMDQARDQALSLLRGRSGAPRPTQLPTWDVIG